MFGRRKEPKAPPVTEDELLDALRTFNSTADELDLRQRDLPDGPDARAIRVRVGRLRDAATLISAQLNAPKQSGTLLRAAIDSGRAALDD
jgi:hypothetical protein